MDEMGKAMMGTGEAEGQDRAVQAAEKAIANPLLDEISLEGARGVLINITGGYDLTLFELDEAANKIREKVDADANIIVGSTLDADMEGKMRVSVVATGIDAIAKTSDIPVPRRPMAAPLTQQVAAEVKEETPAAVVADVPAPEVAPEPTLFDGDAAQPATFDAPAAAEADLPPAAYRPRPESAEIEAPTEAFVAPQRAPVGTPSQETLDRLRTAAQRSAPTAPEMAPAESEDSAKPRMGGLNNLISRMTGHAEGAQKERPQPPAATRREDSPAADADPDQERIEIPAFLRRQAN